MNRGRIHRAALLLVGTVGAALLTPAAAHEPLWGLGPHTIFRGGVGLETEVSGAEGGAASGTELHTELLYGITADVAATLVLPRGLSGPERGAGDLGLRLKWRFDRRDLPGLQVSTAVIGGTQVTGGARERLLAVAWGSEGIAHYWFADVRLVNRDGEPDVFGADLVRGWRLTPFKPGPASYLATDLVGFLELNWVNLSGAGRALYISPGLFATKRNWALKAGLQFPLAASGTLTDRDFNWLLAIESHF